MSVQQRLRDFIKYKNLKIKEFEAAIDVSNGYINSIYKSVGHEVLMKILEAYPNLNLNWLLTGQGSMIVHESANHIKVAEPLILNEPGFIYQPASSPDGEINDEEIEEFTNKNGNKFFILPDKSIKIEVPLMSEPAYATYAEQYFDNAVEVAQDLPKANFDVDKIGFGNYLAFVIKNDSMWNEGEFDTPPGAEILGREVGAHLWPNFHKTDYGFVLMTNQGIFHKDIKEYDKSTGMLTLSSRNPDHKDFEININEVNKVFSVIKRGEVKVRRRSEDMVVSKEIQEETKMYPQRYIDVLENTMRSKDEIIELLKEKNEFLTEQVKEIKEQLKRLKVKE